MKKYQKKVKPFRYFDVFKRRVRKLNQKKVRLWLKDNLKGHPFISGLIFFIWVQAVLVKRIFLSLSGEAILRYHLYLIVAWLLLAGISNALREKGKVQWYLRKRFVAFTLLVAAPVGLILLWSGAKFKRVTKILFTLVFSAIFIVTNLYYDRRYEKVLKQPPFDRIAEMISKPKKQIMIKRISKEELDNLRLERVSANVKNKLAVSEVAQRCSPAVVSIKTKDKSGKEIGLGSGFIISKNGIIITNFHVLESAYSAEVDTGEVVFKDVSYVKGLPSFDIAILKIDSQNLPALPMGNSDLLINGQFVTVLGNPWGLERSVSNGLISAIRSNGSIKLIQMTAPVSPGSSGGPVLNEYGEVVGVTTLASFLLAQNLNFAVPINYLRELIKKN